MDDLNSAGRVRDELVDVFSYLLRLADVPGVDLVAAIRAKLELNEQRYPEDTARGRADKYDQLNVATAESATSDDR